MWEKICEDIEDKEWKFECNWELFGELENREKHRPEISNFCSNELYLSLISPPLFRKTKDVKSNQAGKFGL